MTVRRAGVRAGKRRRTRAMFRARRPRNRRSCRAVPAAPGRLTRAGPPRLPEGQLSDTDAAGPRRTPLTAVHERLGATLTDFAGWLMPLRYGSETAEHNAVRTAAGLFDLSHMGEIAVTGA